jgi:hypothetical protein
MDGHMSAMIRGIHVSNAQPRRLFEPLRVVVTGNAAPGTVVDAFRSRALIDFDSTSSDGRFALAIPLSHGETPVEFVTYTIDGDVRRDSRVLHRLPIDVEIGKLEYSASAGRCLRQCGYAANLSTRFAPGAQSLLGASLYSDIDSGIVATVAVLSLDFVLRNAVRASAAVSSSGSGRLSARWSPASKSRLAIDLVSVGSDPRIVQASGREERAVVNATFLAGAGFAAPAIDVAGGLVRRGRVAFATLSLASTIRTPLGFVRPEVRTDGDTRRGKEDRTSFRVQGMFLPESAIGRLMAQSTATATAEFSAGGRWSALEVALHRYVAPGARIDMELRRSATAEQVQASVAFHSRLPSISYGLRRLSSSRGDAPSFYASGTVHAEQIPGPIGLSGDRFAHRAGLRLKVFVDLNADGVWQESEPPIPAIGVSLGPLLLLTDSSGIAMSTNLSPLEAVVVQLDPATVGDPRLIAPPPVVLDVPRGLRVSEVDIGIPVGTDVEGRAFCGVSDPPLSPATPLALVRLDDNTRRHVHVYADGHVFLAGLTPGEYLLVTEPRDGIEVPMRRFRVRAPALTPDGELIWPKPMRLERLPCGEGDR